MTRQRVDDDRDLVDRLRDAGNAPVIREAIAEIQTLRGTVADLEHSIERDRAAVSTAFERGYHEGRAAR